MEPKAAEHERRAIEYSHAGRHEDALHELELAEQECSALDDKAEFVLSQMDCLLRLSRVSEARQRFARAAKLLPDTEHWQTILAFNEVDLLTSENRTADALRKVDSLIPYYAPSIQESDDHRMMWENLKYKRGMLLADLGEYSKGLNLLREVVSFQQIQPGPEYPYYLGLCYSQLGQYEEAKRWLLQAFDQGLALAFEIPARFLLGVAHFRLGAHAWALREFQLCEQRPSELNVPVKTLMQWLEATCLALNMAQQASEYARRK